MPSAWPFPHTDGRDCLPDPFGRGLDFPVGNVRVSQSHRNLPMTKQPRNRRQWSALHDGVGGVCVPQIMQSDILDFGPLAQTMPEVTRSADGPRRVR